MFLNNVRHYLFSYIVETSMNCCDFMADYTLSPQQKSSFFHIFFKIKGIFANSTDFHTKKKKKRVNFRVKNISRISHFSICISVLINQLTHSREFFKY